MYYALLGILATALSVLSLFGLAYMLGLAVKNWWRNKIAQMPRLPSYPIQFAKAEPGNMPKVECIFCFSPECDGECEEMEREFEDFN